MNQGPSVRGRGLSNEARKRSSSSRGSPVFLRSPSTGGSLSPRNS